MPSSTFYSLNLAANASSGNLLAGDINEFVPVPSVVTIYAVVSALGMQITCLADSDIAVNRKQIPFIGTTLVKKDQQIDSFAVAGGTRLNVSLDDTSGSGTSDTYVCIEVTPIA
jgi:hypothetical protein